MMWEDVDMKRPIGRPKGALSFTSVRLADLVEALPPTAILPVSRIWLEKMGLVIKPADLSVAPITPPPASEVATPVEFTIDQ